MRIDVYLSRVCVLRSRSLAKEACDRGKVTLNGDPAKGSRPVNPGDRIGLDLVLRQLELEVVDIPQRAVSKKAAKEFYLVLRDERLEID